MERERNPELKAFHQLLWELGASQTDVASLMAKSIDWNKRIIRFDRRKTRTKVLIRFGERAAAVLEKLPKSGPLFPWLSGLTEQHRANYFAKRLRTKR